MGGEEGHGRHGLRCRSVTALVAEVVGYCSDRCERRDKTVPQHRGMLIMVGGLVILLCWSGGMGDELVDGGGGGCNLMRWTVGGDGPS